MAETNNGKDDQSLAPTTSGTKMYFPRLTLSKVLELSEKIYELGQGDTVPRLVVFDALGKSASSGPSRTLVTTSNGYGLTTGGYNAERLGLTDTGKDIASATDGQKRALLANLLLREGTLLAKFYSYYMNKNVPVEAMAVDYLKREGNLKEEDAKVAFEIFMSNLREFGFTKELSGKETIVSADLAQIPKIKTTDTALNPIDAPTSSSQPHIGGEDPQPQPQTTTPSALTSVMSAVPQFNFNIQIELPNNSTPETYDAIFKSISEHLLGKDDEKSSEQQ